jgi:hypothetical protein
VVVIFAVFFILVLSGKRSTGDEKEDDETPSDDFSF